ncbi:amino acid adenylation domain-containing protein [Kitasatospora sp. NPDC017646]|uniref:amino acid adenylation domain-containing protein n=1 Tax=Kitasatospora sp. NPDC017646 TaxID=3364024 RepID=UPI00379407C1
MSQSWEGFRLSRQQERVLRLASAGTAGRTVAGVRLGGPIDRVVFERAAHDVASVHESLRSAYRTVLGENSTRLMVIEDEPRIEVTESAGDDAALAAIVRAESRADGFESVLRLILFTHTDQRRSLILSAPRLSVDGASAEVFFRDLQQAYGTRLTGTPWTREDVVQYADFTQVQLDEAAPSAEQAEIAAERRARLTALPPLRLPLELRSTETGHECATWTVPAPLARALRELGGPSGDGLHGVLLTGWIVALWHATGRPEALAVDTMLPGRRFRELATAIGQFESPVPVLTAMSAETTLTALLNSVNQELAAAADLAESLVELPQQHAAGVPGFAFADVAEFPSEAALACADLWVEAAGDARKVGVRAQRTGDEIRLELRHQSRGMAEGGADALLTCLRAALVALVGDGSTTVGSLAMLDAEAARELIAASNASQPPEQRPAHWHRRVEQAAHRFPDRTALRSDTRSWSYREFDEAANRLAGELAGRGVVPGGTVGLCLERSDVAIVAMLAIAKAGAGYVPVDPHLPRRRRSAIAEAVGFRHVVATAESASDLPEGCDVVLVDADLTVCAQRSSERLDVETADDDLAYVLFTSGSTGTPKGVLVGHGQLAAYLDGVLDRLGLDGEIDSVALSSLGTDLGNTTLFPPLMTGGALRVVSADVSADAQALAEVLAEEDYDLLKITPSHLEAVFAVAEEPARLIPREALVLGGEPFAWGAFNMLRTFLGDCRLYNHYGPSETTVGVLCGRVADNELAGLTSTVPLGKPMRHARGYVLDPNLRPVPVGVPGELWIGGSSVSQGYLAGTADQKERFTDDPFSPVAGARMYRTGDRARLLPDLGFEFLGRVDRQIKVRGFRVEIGEIEAVMRQHPRVTGSMVVHTGESMAAHLVGYLIDAEGSRGAAEWLREFLAERLPEFMIPAHLVALDAFPLTSTGKIDAAMLPEPGSYIAGSTSLVEPRTPTERAVADVVAQVLLLKQVGADDDFFEIGGHSLLATQLIAKLRLEFRVSVKLRDLFKRPVVSELAELIDQLLEKKAAGE